MKQLEDILALMQNKLNNEQLQELEMVLQVVLNPCKTVMTDEDAIEYFLKTKKLEGCSDKTIKVYRCELTLLSKNTDKKLVELNSGDIRDYLANYKAAKGISSTTLNNKRNYIASFYLFLFDNQIINQNPLRTVKKIKVEKIEKSSFTGTDVELLRNGCKDSRDRALIEVLLSTGCRVNEISNIKVGDIDWQNKEIKVLGKGSKERVVFFDDRTLYYINRYAKEFGLDTESFLFGRKYHSHQKVTTENIEYLVKRIGNMGGVKTKVHPHRFRRTLATKISEKGMPIEQIKSILGHESFDTTLIYCDTKKSDIRHTYNKLYV